MNKVRAMRSNKMVNDAWAYCAPACEEIVYDTKVHRSTLVNPPPTTLFAGSIMEHTNCR